MVWIVLWALVVVVGATGLIASIGSVRFTNRVSRETQAMVAASSRAAFIDRRRLASLPPPVQRYLTKAIGQRERGIDRVDLRHAGSFRPTLSGSWLRIRGEQHVTADPPSFIWWGRVRIAPGFWIDARDRSVNGTGNMLVVFESTVTVADRSGGELDQSALARLLGELAWMPTAFLDDRYLRWAPIDDSRARATFTVGGRSASAVFVFGRDDLPARFEADRYRDTGGGTSVMTPFVGTYAEFRPADGVLVPFRLTGAWVVDGQTIEFATFDVEEIDVS